eukprot:XP_001705963.1 Hypothetical protein GL50803_115328 [Giardia lamblia ATCC 50803]
MSCSDPVIQENSRAAEWQGPLLCSAQGGCALVKVCVMATIDCPLAGYHLLLSH